MQTHMPLGIDDFKELYTSYYFIDKTDFIRQLLAKPSKVTLITRPRRFGKTLTMSMLYYFFSIDKKAESANLFQHLAIAKAGASYMQKRGKYPVIYLTLKELSQHTWEDMYQSFVFLIRKEFNRHPYLWNSPVLTEMDKEYGQHILSGTGSRIEYQMSLLQLTEFLARYFGVKPIVLIDEYDAPLHEAYEKNFYQEALSFFKIWFNATLKSNTSLHFAFLTGVLRIAKESIFSGLNNLLVCSVLSEQYSTAFGFTTAEIKHMLHELHLENKLSEIQYWYDGYRFGNTEIYNPWSVISYILNNVRPSPIGSIHRKMAF